VPKGGFSTITSSGLPSFTLLELPNRIQKQKREKQKTSEDLREKKKGGRNWDRGGGGR
jgi:hypothetical protein